MSKGIILDLCGGTGAWSKPYADNGYDVRVLTLPDHDVVELVNDSDFYNSGVENVVGILAAPPCTMFSIARNDKTAKEPRSFRKGMETVEACLRIIWEIQNIQSEVWGHTNMKLKFWALENPNSGYLKRYLGKPTFVFEPYEFGDSYTKKTALWGYFNEPKKRPVKPIKRGNSEGTFVKEVEHFKELKQHQIPEGYKEKTGYTWRTIVRSITPEGFAQAFYKANK